MRTVVYAIKILTLMAVSMCVAASDTYEPVLESLQILQKQAALKAAPSGQDSVNDNPAPEPIEETEMEVEEELSTLTEKAKEKLDGVTLQEQRQTQALEEPLQQFGYDIFDRTAGPAALDNAPVPDDYIVNSGDTLVVQIYGKRNVEYRLVVTREGKLLIPEFGPMHVAGLNFDEISEVITSNFEERVIGAKAVVTMGALRTMQIRIAGDVRAPGIYTLSGMSTLIDGLFHSGGIKYSGSLRDIQVKRNNKTVANFDLYGLLLFGESTGDIQLQHNDVIFIPPIGDVVAIGGEVSRPGIYEIRDETTLDEAIALAGGLLASASLTDSHVERIVSGKYRTLVDAWNRSINALEREARQQLSAGDFIRILPMDETLDGVVLLEGHVKRPGGYQHKRDMRVSDLIGDKSSLLPGADTKFALVQREGKGDGKSVVRYVKLDRALSKRRSSYDLKLKPRDRLIVFEIKKPRAKTLDSVTQTIISESEDPRLADVVKILGHARYPGKFPLQSSTRLLNVLDMVGGIQVGTDMVYGVISRERHQRGELTMQSFSLSLALQAPESDSNPYIMPGDTIYLFNSDHDRSQLMVADLQRIAEQSNYMHAEELVRANGQVRDEGLYPLESNMRASDLLCAANGVGKNGYGMSAELSRRNSSSQSVSDVTHIVLDAKHLIELCELRRRTARHSSAMFAGKSATKDRANEDQARNAWQDFYEDDELNPLLSPGDQLTFVQKTGWPEMARVVLSGEVGRPGVYVIRKGETLCSVLKRAGGLSKEAYPFGAVFTRRSVKQVQQETLDAIQEQLDDLLVDLSLSHSVGNNDKAPIVNRTDEYVQIIRKLKKAQPNGRMVIDLDGAEKCKSKADVALEDGDSLSVPAISDQVYVSGQVYVPTSHMYRKGRRAEDYVDLSGGATVLGRLKDTYVVQANGEVTGLRVNRRASKILKSRVRPGAKIVVPLNVDRMNGTERAQSWTKVFLETAILAGVIL